MALMMLFESGTRKEGVEGTEVETTEAVAETTSPSPNL